MSESVGEFSLKHAGSTYGKAADGDVAEYVNWEGSATGYGQVFGTLIFKRPLAEMGATSGTCTWVGQGFLEDTSVLGAMGEGTWEQVPDQHVWKLSLVVEISNGDKVRSEGEISLATLEYNGQLFEAE